MLFGTHLHYFYVCFTISTFVAIAVVAAAFFFNSLASLHRVANVMLEADDAVHFHIAVRNKLCTSAHSWVVVDVFGS